MTYTAKLKCAIFGHKRGRRANDLPLETGKLWFRCPRCSAMWMRKARPVKLTAVA